MTTTQPIIDKFDKLGILPHGLPNAIGMWPNEQECLVWCALQCNPNLDWWEVGSFCGGSTILLGFAQESLEGEGNIISVDPNPKPIMDLNIKRAKLNDRIVRYKTTSKEALEKNHNSIGFLFLDGWHSFSAVLAEFEAAMYFLAENAIVGFHDVSPKMWSYDKQYTHQCFDYTIKNWNQLINSSEQDFRIDEAVTYLCKEYEYEIVDIPVREPLAYHKETNLDRWVRGRTSPHNAFTAIRKIK